MTSARIPSIGNVIPNDWNSLLRFTRDVQKYLNSLARSDQTLYISDLVLSSLTASRLIASDASQKLISTALSAWVAGTANQIIVTDDGDGTITISTPQDIATTSSPQFANLTITAGGKLYLDGS